MPFYAVRVGRKPGIFASWAECEAQVKGFSSAVYKKFKTKHEAERFVNVNRQHGNQSATIRKYGNSTVNTQELQEQKEIEEILKEALENENMLSPPKKIKLNDDNKPADAAYKPIKYGDYLFDEDSDGYVRVFTDGSCENNGKEGAIAGLGVFFGINHPLNSSEPVNGRATNNIGEIQASIKAIKDAQMCGIDKLNIFTDSQFLINSVCKWMSTWKSNDWTLSRGKTVVNKEDFIILDNLINSGNMNIKWSYIPAHSGHFGNEQADRLAREGARKQRK